MGQQALFGGWEATRLELSIGFAPSTHRGWMHVGTLDELGRALTHRSINWAKERDFSGFPDVARIIASAWLYGTPEDVIWEATKAVAEHMPEVKLAP